MAHAMENSWTISEEYHIDEEVGFALPNPQVREGTKMWENAYSSHFLPGQVNLYLTTVVQ